jgi:hypothetical protein
MGQVAIVTTARHCITTVLILDLGCRMTTQTLLIGIFGKKERFLGTVDCMTTAATLLDRFMAHG